MTPPSSSGPDFAATPLDTAIEAEKAGRTPMADLFRALVAAEVAVPSGGEVAADGDGFRPLLFDKAGVPMIACFSSREAMTPFGDLAPYALMMRGGEFLRRVPHDHGVVVNPDPERGFDVPPEGVRGLIRDFVDV